MILKYKRLNRLSYRQLAEAFSQAARAPVTGATVCNWARGKYPPSLLYMRELARGAEGGLRELALAVLAELEGEHDKK